MNSNSVGCFSERIFFAILFSLSFVFFFSCKKENINVCAATAVIDYSTCTSGGCQLQFTCGNAAFTNQLFMKDGDCGLMSKVLGTCLLPTAAPMNIASVTINQPWLLQATAGTAPKNWYNSNVTCYAQTTVTAGLKAVSCPGFLPIAKDQTLNFTLGNNATPYTVHVTVTPSTPSSTTVPCGQNGTTVQRMFDCSMKVQNYAGIGHNGAASVPFTPATTSSSSCTMPPAAGQNCNPDFNWFLVACPNTASAGQTPTTNPELCSWLSPAVQPGNPAIVINCNSSIPSPNCDPTSPNISPGTRIIWSGVLNNGALYNFGQTNGTNNGGLPNCLHTDGTTSGQCAQYVTVSSQTAIFQGMIQTFNFGFPANQPNLCVQQLSNKDAGFSGMSSSAYNWIVPSYPMMLTLTGFVGCNPATNGCIGEGFSAISAPIPSFQTSPFLWSSSVIDLFEGWLFDSGLVGSFDFLLGNTFVARCSSVAW